jgi:RNA polymerase sigma-70 factor, ECF subfamily
VATVRSDEGTGRLDVTAHESQSLVLFVEQHYPRLVVLAGLVCGDTAAAEDVVQVALERAWRAREAIHDPARLRPWLDRIVVREAARERRSRLAWLGRIVRLSSARDVPTERRDPVDRSASGFPERSAIRGAFAGLSSAQRAVMVLTVQAGYSIDETAVLLGVPRDTVRSRLRSAREQLRYALKEAR